MPASPEEAEARNAAHYAAGHRTPTLYTGMELHPWAALLIRDVYVTVEDISQSELARQLGVAMQTVNACLSGQVFSEDPTTWRTGDVVDGFPDLRPCVTGKSRGGWKLTELDVQVLRDMYDAGGLTQGALAEFFGISSAHVSRIVNRQVWADVPALTRADLELAV
jgi:plasmid maintenance system antidote protein VapI